MSRAVIVNLIGSTTTRHGLQINAALDENTYEKGIEVSEQDFQNINIEKDKFHGDWNYTIRPH